MIQISEIDETLMSICAETQGRFEMDAESGDPNGTFACARLIQLGYTSQSLDSAGEKDGLSMNYLYRLARPETPAETAIGEMHPECLKFGSIIQKCELKISVVTANNAISKDEKNAYNASYIRKKIGKFERNTEESIPPKRKTNGWLWKRVAGQVGRSSLEWLHR